MIIKKQFCLFLHKYALFGYSLELTRRCESNEYPKHTFYREITQLIKLSPDTQVIRSDNFIPRIKYILLMNVKMPTKFNYLHHKILLSLAILIFMTILDFMLS